MKIFLLSRPILAILAMTQFIVFYHNSFAWDNGSSITITGYISNAWYANGDDNNQGNDDTVTQMEAVIVKRLFPTANITPNVYSNIYDAKRVPDVIWILQQNIWGWSTPNGFLYGSSGKNTDWIDYTNSYLLIPDSQMKWKSKNILNADTYPEKIEYDSLIFANRFGNTTSYKAQFEIKGTLYILDQVVPISKDGCIVEGMKSKPARMYDNMRFCKGWDWDMRANKIHAKVIIVESMRIINGESDQIWSPVKNIASVKKDIVTNISSSSIGTVTLPTLDAQRLILWSQLKKIDADERQKLDSELAVMSQGTKKEIQALIVAKTKRKQAYMKIQKSISLNIKKVSKLPDSPQKIQLISQYSGQLEYVKWRIASVSLVIANLKQLVMIK